MAETKVLTRKKNWDNRKTILLSKRYERFVLLVTGISKVQPTVVVWILHKVNKTRASETIHEGRVEIGRSLEKSFQGNGKERT